MTCGQGVRTRSLKCVKDDGSGQEVAQSQCPAGSQPEVTEACVSAVCSPDISELGAGAFLLFFLFFF